MKAFVEFAGVSKRFGGVSAVDGVSLAIERGEFFCLLGPSGCGKTTLMRLLAGFETPDAGDIRLEGASLLSTPPHQRPTNMMFQSYALFPHMDVATNIGFGLKQAGLPKKQIAERVAELLTLVKLEDLAKRRPDQLSGGQKQRVALARALARRPKVLLLDEPLGALDRKLRGATQYELKAIQTRLGITFLMVTHDQDEAMVMADRIGLMDRGKLVQVGAPRVLYERPANRFVAEFLGDVTVLPGKAAGEAGPGQLMLDTPIGPIRVAQAGTMPSAGAEVDFAIRPEKIALARAEPGGSNQFRGEITDLGYLGDITLVQLAVPAAGGRHIAFRVSLANRERETVDPLRRGEIVWISWPTEAGLLLGR